MNHWFSGAACPRYVWLVAIILALHAPLRADDEELMKSLDSELLEGLETLPTEESAKPETADAAENPSGQDEDEFSRISKQMRQIERLIPQLEKEQPTRKLQKAVVADLDKLIEQLEQQCKKCQGGSSSSKPQQQTAEREAVKQPSQSGSGEGQQNSSKPARDATERLVKDELRKADMAQMKGLLKDLWGQLPEKAREQMLQSSPEQFLPKYELLIEDYYRRLAEKQQSNE